MLKKLIRNLLPFTLLLVAFPADAQLTPQGVEQPITYSGKVASLAVNTPALNFSVTTGVNTFILAAQPETAARIYIVNETSNACAAAFQISVATTSQKNIGSFNNNQQNWATVPIINTSGSYAANSGIVAIPALGSVVITSSAIAGQNVAVFVVNTNGSCASTSIDVLVEFATVSITSPLINVASGNNIVQPGLVANVQGIVSNGTNIVNNPVNPVIMGGKGQPGANPALTYSVSTSGDSASAGYNSMPIGGDKTGPTAGFPNTVTLPQAGAQGGLVVFPTYLQSGAGLGVFAGTLSDGFNGVASSNAPGQNVTNTGFFKSSSVNATSSGTVPVITPPGKGLYRSCYVTVEITNAGPNGTLDIYWQSSNSGTVWTDRIHFAQALVAASNQFAGISDSIGITPTVETTATMAASTKLDGPIGAWGRFQLVITGAAPNYTINYGVACS